MASTYSQSELELARRFGSRTKNGVCYRFTELPGRDSARFELLFETHHTPDDLERAKEEIRHYFDVFGNIGLAVDENAPQESLVAVQTQAVSAPAAAPTPGVAATPFPRYQIQLPLYDEDNLDDAIDDSFSPGM